MVWVIADETGRVRRLVMGGGAAQGAAQARPGETAHQVTQDAADLVQAGPCAIQEGRVVPIDLEVPLEAQARDLRAQRDRLLAASDWTQAPDAPVDAAAWRAYRQALRDVTRQAGFPETVIWPDRPSVQKEGL